MCPQLPSKLDTGVEPEPLIKEGENFHVPGTLLRPSQVLRPHGNFYGNSI